MKTMEVAYDYFVKPAFDANQTLLVRYDHHLHRLTFDSNYSYHGQDVLVTNRRAWCGSTVYEDIYSNPVLVLAKYLSIPVVIGDLETNKQAEANDWPRILTPHFWGGVTEDSVFIPTMTAHLLTVFGTANHIESGLDSSLIESVTSLVQRSD